LRAKSGAERAEREAVVPVGSLFHGKSFRHTLHNFWDLQYAGTFRIGGQDVRGVLDTGSFELLVFSRNCHTCGEAAAYDEMLSQATHKGGHKKVLAYGSGRCDCIDIQDEVKIGSAVVAAQDLWMAEKCEMPLLSSASFDSVVGVGPPGQVAKVARRKLAEQAKLEEDYVNQSKPVPEDVREAKRKILEELHDGENKKTLLENLDIKTFSACFGRASGTPGWITWNDARREGVPGVRKVHVAGEVTWGIKLGEVGFSSPSGEEVLGCKDGCGAIVDTGTSLLGVPSELYSVLRAHLSPDGQHVECHDLHDLPKLFITIGEHRFYLPPTAFVGKMYGSVSAEVQSYLHKDSFSSQKCSLLFMNMGNQKTQFGPMFILGIPFLREFYTTFDLGSSGTERSLFISPANDECFPDTKPQVREFAKYDSSPLEVDVAKVRIPEWLRNRAADII